MRRPLVLLKPEARPLETALDRSGAGRKEKMYRQLRQSPDTRRQLSVKGMKTIENNHGVP
jgi:hypothetical protein